MSRIGKVPVDIPSGVEITLDQNTVNVKGPKEELVEDFLVPRVDCRRGGADFG